MAESLERNEGLRKQMTSDVAHELRTPLNNISGYLDAITDGVVEPTSRSSRHSRRRRGC
jgi:signal transduction histidine kinase